MAWSHRRQVRAIASFDGARSRGCPWKFRLGFEQLEERLVLTGSPIPPDGADPLGDYSILPGWFEQYPASLSAGSLAAEPGPPASVQKINWKGESLDVFANEWIVQLTTEAAVSLTSVLGAQSLLATADPGISYEIVGGLGMVGQFLLRAGDASFETVSGWLSNNSAVKFWEPNAVLPLQLTPNDSSYASLWGLNNTGQTGGTIDADIDAPEAWNISTGSSEIVVAIIDTGVDYTHSDLAANIWTNPGEIAGNGVDDDHNGFVDDVHGYDFVNNDGDPMDDNSHGTHVAGTIAGAGNDGAGVAGVNWTSSIMGLKFLSGSGSGSTSNAIRAVNYATMMRSLYDVNVRVTNNSWGGGGYSQGLHDAIAASGAADILFVAAAGNSASNNDLSQNYPSNYDLPNVIAVAAADHNDHLASFSSYGATTVDLAAPGVGIYSSVPGNAYASYSGTSMATPHVAGVAALAWATAPNATAAEIRAAILGGVDHLDTLNGVVVTSGRLNALNTLSLLGMSVSGSTPAVDSIVAQAPTVFDIDFNRPYDSASVAAVDLAVNGIAANNVTLIDADTVRFTFNASPVTAEGLQTMRIAAGSILQSDGSHAVVEWQRTFFHDLVVGAVVSTNPAQGEIVSQAPTDITLTFNEAIDPATVSADLLTLGFGTVTGAVMAAPNAVRFTVVELPPEGTVTYTLAERRLADAHGTPIAGYAGSFVIDDPTLMAFASTDTPVAIPEFGTVTSTLVIAVDYPIYDLDVRLNISHTWESDLTLWLIAPNGTVVKLAQEVGLQGDEDYTNTIFDDEATTPIYAATAPFTGRFRPENPLSVLDGSSTVGTWQLTVTDGYALDSGFLENWSLIVRVQGNLAPALAAIDDQAVSHAAGPQSVIVSATDAENDAINYSAAVQSVSSIAYQLDQELGLDYSESYWQNLSGGNEKYMLGNADIWYYILPNGELHRAIGYDLVNDPLIATLDEAFYDDPSLLHDAPLPGPAPAAVSMIGNQVVIDPNDGFVGRFQVTVTANDGSSSSSQSFWVDLTNQAPVIQAIADQAMPNHHDTLTVPLAASDPDGDAATFIGAEIPEFAVAQLAYQLDQSLQFSLASSSWDDYWGLGEKWLLSDNGWHYITPDGRLYDTNGGNELVATLSPAYHANLSLLSNAVDPGTAPATLSIVNNSLVIDPRAGYLGSFNVTVSASDGHGVVRRTFALSVVPNSAPLIQPIADQSIWYQNDATVVAFTAADADNDALTYSAQIQGSNPPAVALSVANGMITIDPPAGYVGRFSVQLQVSDGVAASAQTFRVSVSNGLPEIEVAQGSNSLANGSAPPVDFGSIMMGQTASRTFTVSNIGFASLNLNSASFVLPAGYRVASNFAAAIVAPEAATTFTILLDAAQVAQLGAQAGVVTFSNDDSDETVFSIAVTGFANVPFQVVMFAGNEGGSVESTPTLTAFLQGPIVLPNTIPDYFRPTAGGGAIASVSSPLIFIQSDISAAGPLSFRSLLDKDSVDTFFAASDNGRNHHASFVFKKEGTDSTDHAESTRQSEFILDTANEIMESLPLPADLWHYLRLLVPASEPNTSADDLADANRHDP